MKTDNKGYFVCEQNYNTKKKKPPAQTFYELRYKINKFNHEVLGCWALAAIAYGMRKKLLNEKPEQYHKSKLHVVKLN